MADAARLDPGRPFDAAGFVDRLADFARAPEMKRRLDAVKGLVRRKAPARDAADALGRSVLAQDAVPFAVFCFVTNPNEASWRRRWDEQDGHVNDEILEELQSPGTPRRA